MKRIAVVVLLATAALAMSDPTSASADYWRQCGNQPKRGAGWYHVRAHGIGCGEARSIAHRYTWSAFYGNSDPHPGGFDCQEVQVASELTRVACQRSKDGAVQKVRFNYGA